MPNFARQNNSTKAGEKEIQENIDYSVAMMRWLLQAMGLWPYIVYPHILRILLIAVVSFLLVSVVIPVSLYILIEATDIEMQLQLLGPLSFGFMNAYKYYVVLFQEKQLHQCIERIANDWRSVGSRMENYLMRENAKYAKSFTIICGTCSYTAGLSHAIFFSFVLDPIEINNVTVRPLTYSCYFIFFNPYDYFKLIYTIQLLYTFTIFSITVAVESIGIACVMHVCGQINVISWMLHNLAADTFDKMTFGQIIEKHLRAIALAEKLEKFLNSICFVEFVGCSFNMCMLGYYIITYRNQHFLISGTYCMVFVSFTFNMFIFCYIGEQLTEKVHISDSSENCPDRVMHMLLIVRTYYEFGSKVSSCGNIGNAAYNVDWYRLPAKDAKNLLMIVVSTNRPVMLTAGKMATLSMTSFSRILKASFSYLNMLRTVT